MNIHLSTLILLHDYLPTPLLPEHPSRLIRMGSFYQLYGDLTLKKPGQHLDEIKAARLTELHPHFRRLEVKRIRGSISGRYLL